MKVNIVLGLLAVSSVAVAQYHYRPPGQPFPLPSKSTAGVANQGFASNPQNRYGAPVKPPTNQYGPPRGTQAPPPPPPQEYLPNLQPEDFRNNFGRQQGQGVYGGQGSNGQGVNEQGFNGQGFNGQRVNEQGFNGQAFNGQGFNEQGVNRQGVNGQGLNGQGSNEQGYNGQAYNRQAYNGQGYNRQGFNQQSSNTQGSNVQSFSGQDLNGQTSSSGYAGQAQGFSGRDEQEEQDYSRRDESFASQRPFLGPNVQSNEQQRNYLPPADSTRSYQQPQRLQNNQQQTQRLQSSNQQQRLRTQVRSEKQQLYETPQPSHNSGNDASAGDAGDYLPPTTTEVYPGGPTKRRRYPEPTTSRPDVGEAEPDIDEDEEEPENPNVAVSTAVARGQYYLIQPDGRLQRIVYKTTQTQEDLKNSGVAAVYQNVEPIAAPIYAYNAALIAQG